MGHFQGFFLQGTSFPFFPVLLGPITRPGTEAGALTLYYADKLPDEEGSAPKEVWILNWDGTESRTEHTDGLPALPPIPAGDTRDEWLSQPGQGQGPLIPSYSDHTCAWRCLRIPRTAAPKRAQALFHAVASSPRRCA